jgi:ubiquinone/menaquinone biosynthesis C-methylase UbiE
MKDTQIVNKILKNTGDMCLKRRAKLLLKELDLQKSDNILDVGCGDGFYLYLLSQMGKYKITGIDSDAVALDNVKKQVNSKDIKLLVGDVTKMPFKDNTFSKLVCSEVLEHLPDDRKGLREMYRIMKKGGTLCITVPHWNYPFFWDPVNYILQRAFKTHIKSGFWSGVWNFHIRLYQVAELEKAVKSAGFTIEKVSCLTHYGLPFNHYITNIGFRLRTSEKLPQNMKDSLSKFHPEGKRTFFSTALDIINFLDRRNNREFSRNTSTVGIFLKARKI